MPSNKSYPTDSSSAFDRHIHSPEAEASRRETLMQVQKNHETQEKAFPDVKSVHISEKVSEKVSGKEWTMKTLTPMEKLEAVTKLPLDVQGFLTRKPEHVQAILNGQTIFDSISIAGIEVNKLVSSTGIKIIENTEDE